MQTNHDNNEQIQLNSKNLLGRFFRQTFLKSKTAILEEPDDKIEIADLLESVKEAREEWLEANNNFENARDAASVDYYTYKIKASEIKYQDLLRRLKEKRTVIKL